MSDGEAPELVRRVGSAMAKEASRFFVQRSSDKERYNVVRINDYLEPVARQAREIMFEGSFEECCEKEHLFQYQSLARAAIAAMRDPPQCVLDALQSWAQCEGDIEEGWNAAIDAALETEEI